MMLNVLAETMPNIPVKVNGVSYPDALTAYNVFKDTPDLTVTVELNSTDEVAQKVCARCPYPLSKPAHILCPDCFDELRDDPEILDYLPDHQFEQPTIYRVKVRQYMTKPATPDFNFMDKYNGNKPMPLRVMYGEVLEETKGMYRMRLHGRAERDAVACVACFRTLTHPISMFYGIGPECGGHNHVAPIQVLEAIEDREEMFNTVDEQLRQVVWEGWIIKKAIESKIEVR